MHHAVAGSTYVGGGGGRSQGYWNAGGSSRPCRPFVLFFNIWQKRITDRQLANPWVRERWERLVALAAGLVITPERTRSQSLPARMAAQWEACDEFLEEVHSEQAEGLWSY